MVVGLGNPGEEYAGTRHNLGAVVVTMLADRLGGSLRRSRNLALSCEVHIGDQRVALALPQTFMNESGQSVGNGEGGYLVIRDPWPAMLRGVWGDPQRFRDNSGGI